MKADDMSETKTIELYCTFFDVCMEKIRDLLYGNALGEFDGQKTNPEIYEDMQMCDNLNRDEQDRDKLLMQGLVKKAHKVKITSLRDLDKIITDGLRTKERLSQKSNDSRSESRTHIVFNLCVKITDRTPGVPNPEKTSIIQFVRLGGGEKMSKGNELLGGKGQNF